MRVGQLIKLLQSLPSNAIIVSPYSDHKYRRVDAREGTALYSSAGFEEDWGEPDEELKQRSIKRVGVVIID